MNQILVTGGLGYIGRHFVLVALNAGFKITVIDNLSNTTTDRIEAIAQLSPIPFEFIKGDLRDRGELESIFKTKHYDSVVHFAGLKSVGESYKDPLVYYENNVVGSLNLLHAMQQSKVKKLIFSSSATVYGHPIQNPYVESHPTQPVNPYGKTKLFVEQLLSDVCHVVDDFSAIALRYFNPIGAHSSGLLSDDPRALNNLMPYIVQVANQKRSCLPIYGNDYPTLDGTGVRDYIHVLDLVEGHLRALAYQGSHTGFEAFNLGTGVGYSVLQILEAFEEIHQCNIPFTIKPRRLGDLPAFWADATKANRKLHWQAKRSLREMVQDSWQSRL